MKMHDHRVCVGSPRYYRCARVFGFDYNESSVEDKEACGGGVKIWWGFRRGRSEVNVQGRSKQKGRSSVNGGLGV